MFWLGAKAIDYVLEFRQFGVSVSQQRRGIISQQQLLVPFYPIIDNNPFQGFPKEFKIPESNVRAYQQFGNSVAVPVVTKISEQIVEQILEV